MDENWKKLNQGLIDMQIMQKSKSKHKHINGKETYNRQSEITEKKRCWLEIQTSHVDPTDRNETVINNGIAKWKLSAPDIQELPLLAGSS